MTKWFRKFLGSNSSYQNTEHEQTIRRLLGFTLDGAPLFEPINAGSSICFAGSGAGKTTCVAVPAIQAMLSDEARAIFINDVKDGEIAMQIADLCKKYGRPFGVVDDFNVLGENFPHKISVNPFSGSIDAARKGNSDLLFINENYTHALIPEPGEGDTKNFYWREMPRQFIELGVNILLRQRDTLATPGGLFRVMNDPDVWLVALELEAEDPTSPLAGQAMQILNMQRLNPEHYDQHILAALTALKIFSSGPLSIAGENAEFSHEELIECDWIVCFVNPARHAERLGPYFALHFLSLLQAQFSLRNCKADYVLDEYCNAPLKALVSKITIYRSFGARAHFIAQSRSDSIRQYGDKQTQTLIENCSVVQYLKFSSIEEAEHVSKAIGDTLTVNESLNYNSDRFEYSGGISLSKDRIYTANDLMSLPPDEQIIYFPQVGWVRAKKVRQNQIAPTCFELGENKLEGGRLPPDPRVRLPVPKGGVS